MARKTGRPKKTGPSSSALLNRLRRLKRAQARICPEPKSPRTRYALKPEDILTSSRLCWMTREGEAIRIYEMEDSHLLNTINYLDRRGVGDPIIYNALLKEARHRGLRTR